MANIVNFLTQVLTPVQNTSTTPVVSRKSSNPFQNNPFVNYNGHQYDTGTYAKNKPVKGGYFAGYYNGKQNIVGKRLFVEV